MTRARGILAFGFVVYACTTYDEGLKIPSGSQIDRGGQGGGGGASAGGGSPAKGGTSTAGGSAGSAAAGEGGSSSLGGAGDEVGGEGGVLGFAGEAGAGGEQGEAVGTGSIKYKRWNNEPGWSLIDIPVDSRPADQVNALSELAFEGEAGEVNYGVQLVGFITAPVSGQYRFWIACDNNCELRLSSDETVAGLKVIAYVAGQFIWTEPREYDKQASQASATLLLTRGRRYRVDIRLKQADGGSHLAVAWQKPGQTTGERAIVPGIQLTPDL